MLVWEKPSRLVLSLYKHFAIAINFFRVVAFMPCRLERQQQWGNEPMTGQFASALLSVLGIRAAGGRIFRG